MNWLHFFGLDNGGETPYLFWSGIGSDIPMFAAALGLVANFYVQVRKHNCEVRGCWHISRHKVEATGHYVCRRHHPEGAPTAQRIRELHLRHNQSA